MYARPPTLPLSGNLLAMKKAPHTALLAWAQEYGGEGLHELKITGSNKVIHIVDPAIAKDLLSLDRFDTFPDRGGRLLAIVRTHTVLSDCTNTSQLHCDH